MAASLAAAAAAAAGVCARRLCRTHHRQLHCLLSLRQQQLLLQPPPAQQHARSLQPAGSAAALARAHSGGGGLVQLALLPSQRQRHCSTLAQQQQQLHQEQQPEAAAAAGVRAQARVWEQQLALAVSATRAASDEARPALLDAATSMMVQQLQVAGAEPPPALITGLLHLYEAQRRALPPAAAQSLLRHAARTTHQWRVVHILRLLRSVAYSRVHDKAAGGGGVRSAAQAWPSVLPLFQQLLNSAAPGSAEPLWGVVVPQLLRYASVMGAQLPQPMLGEFVQLWLDAVRSSTSTSSIDDGADANGNSSGDSSKQATPASAASHLMRAVALLGQQLQPQQLQQMLQLLLAADDDSTQQQQRAAATAGANSATCKPSDAVGAALTTAAWLPRLLEAAHCRHQASFAQEQRVRLLAMAGQSLQHLAVGGVDSGSSGSSSSSSSTPQPAHIASAIAALVRALSLAQRASPLSSTPGLVDRLAGVMVTSQATPRQLMTFTESLGKLHLPPSPERMAAITAAVVAGLSGPRAGQHDTRQQQRRQQQQQPPQEARAVDIARFLWACAYMGYALQEPQLVPLLQQVTARLEPHRATFPVAQALWALSHMGAIPAPQQADSAGTSQQQPGSSPATDAASGLALALIQAAVQEQQQGQQHQVGVTGGSRKSSSSAPGTAGAEQQAAGAAPAPADGAGVRSDNMGRQLSIVCWGAAMCDLTAARDSVLQLCAVLAQPTVFATLQHHELVQLGLVHLWLSGDYLWSDTRGLAAVMSKQQLERIHAAKVLQGRRVTASKQGLVSQLLSQTAAQLAAAPQQQQQQHDGQAEQPLLQLLQQRQHDAYMPGRRRSDSETTTSSSSSRRRLQQAEREQRRLQQQWEDEEREARAAFAAAAAAAPAAVALGAGGGVAAGPDSQAAAADSRTGPSNAQRRLYLAVSELPEIRAAQLEVLTHDSMFPVDVHAVTHAGQACVFEFDGPFHYTRLVPLLAPQAPPASAGGGDGKLAVPVPGRRHRGTPRSVQHAWEAVATHQLREVAATHFRNKALAARGFVVVCVPYYDWCQMPSPRQRQEYIQRRLMAALQRQQQRQDR